MSNTATKIVIHETRIIGTKISVLSAWTPSSYTGRHQTVMSINGVCHGKLGTERIPAEIDAMKPGSWDRCDAVDRWYSDRKDEAYAAIIAARPEAADGICDGMGEIQLMVEE